GFSIGKSGDGMFRFNVKDTGVLEYRLIAGKDIVEVYDTFIRLVGKPRTTPPEGYFTRPIFNTWIEFKKEVSQQGLLEYARTLRRHGFPCEVFMIDDMWQTSYGDYAFDRDKFPDPGAMVQKMHELGFKVVLWVVPFVDFDARSFALLKKRGHLVLDGSGKKPCRVSWWNGESSLVDLSNPEAFGWFVAELQGLQARYGIDGFKLDGGDAEFFRPEFRSFGGVAPNRYTDLFARAGSHFAINEYRVSWLVQDLGLVQRLRDKNNDWNIASGLGSLVPHGLTESLIGYSYFCPDIIGGGEEGDFREGTFRGMDPELFVRWTEASALMPMMQFSFAPWNLDEGSLAVCARYARLHEQLGDYIYGLALQAAETGRPIARPLFFRNPEDEKTYGISDQFLLGDRLLVAPVLTRGARQRDVYLPAGLWKDFWSGEVYRGARELKAYPAPLEKLPVFVCIE
ncbi:MAG: alpha-galactosidase, partial [Candidatus Glassbacteria bacterium]|nr:alpha-galactosidase [Candidatus Glassbacteria bacterium]